MTVALLALSAFIIAVIFSGVWKVWAHDFDGRIFDHRHGTARLVFWVLSLRYRLRLEGVDEVKKIDTPILFLFEHAARQDSFFLFVILSRMRSLASGKPFQPGYVAEGDVLNDPKVQSLCRSKWLTLPKVYGSPTATDPEERKIQAEKLIGAVVRDLKSGHHVAMSPTGMLIRAGGRTEMKKKYGTASVLQSFQAGELTVIATKFDGLFGSLWSRALDNELPTPALIKKVLGSFARGAVVLSCRRRVGVSFSRCELPIGPEATVETVNRAIEGIFSEARTGTYVPYNFLENKTLVELSRELAKP